MSRQHKDPLRPVRATERVSLVRLSRAASAPAAQVARARALLAVAEGLSYTAPARLVGRRTGDTVARWGAGFNRAGLAAVVPCQGGGHRVRYGEATSHSRRSGPAAGPGAGWYGGLVAEHAAGRPASGRGRSARRQHLYDRPHPPGGRCQPAEEPHLVRNGRGPAPAPARRPGQPHRSGGGGKQGLIERAYTQGSGLGLAVWCTDEAAPFQAVPHPGSSWRPHGPPPAAA